VRWPPVAFGSTGSRLTDKEGYLPATSPEVAQHAQPADIGRELRAQIDAALSSGVTLTHLDSHMWAVGRAARDEYLQLGRWYGLAVLMDHEALQLQVDPAAVLIDRILALQAGVPAAQWLSTYEEIPRPLPPGTYQPIVHLAYADDEMRAATYDHPNWGAQ
jgi:hypothetical protein